ncbi:MAG: DNA mismatch repair endonuclease MutL [Holosporales bacterium]|nr:DNA mismatch repair endonuclease MutL [Holosporales bacterium]
MSIIRRLSPSLINQIAAGEVIARPAAAVKELVENALDAQSTCIDVYLENGGKSAIIVKDNGVGMSSEDLALCVERHTTSKLQDLTRISTFGFRGEALAALGSVCRMTITSRKREKSQAFCVRIEGGRFIAPLAPAALTEGTRVEAQDLFFVTPARLKFLKSTAVELGHCAQIVKRLALANPHVTFQFFEGSKRLFSYQQNDQKTRIIEVLEKLSADNLLSVEKTQGALSVFGVIGKPTCTQATSAKQFFFANKRAVQDACFNASLRAAYQELIARERYAVAVLFLALPLEDIDVNVHPAKTEVRFREARRIQLFLTEALSQTLRTDKSIWTGPKDAEKHFAVSFSSSPPSFKTPPPFPCNAYHLKESPPPLYKAPPPLEQSSFLEDTNYPLGHAKAQVHRRYIVAETQDEIVIVDQHAAHERIVYEKIKSAFASTGAVSQALLMPIVLRFSNECLELFAEHQAEFARLGLQYQIIEPEELTVFAIPTFMEGADPKPLMQDLAEELKMWGKGFALVEKFHEVFATFSCHTSIRSGRELSVIEMNTLLRTIERTEHSGQCNHGRPTYVKIPLSKCDKLFER